MNSVVNSVSQTLRKEAIFLALCCVAFLAMFWAEIRDLVIYWEKEPDFSHGFAIPFISGIILWANRERLAKIPNTGYRFGLVLLIVSIALVFLGHFSGTNSFKRLGLIGGLVGGVGFVLGTQFLKASPFPFVFLLFSIPPPLWHLAKFRLKLQQLVTDLTARVLYNFGDNALAQGNVLIVGDATFGVTEACSGIRSLMAIVTTAALLAYLLRAGMVKGVILVALAIPITIAVNVLRLLIIAWAWVHWDIQALASGWPHEVLGLVCFVLSLGLLFVSYRVIDWVAPNKQEEGARHEAITS